MSNTYDVIVLGGGAAGLMAAITAGKRGRRVLVLEVSNKLGKKILMSGGGRCNFTNLEVLPEHFLSSNPHFVKSALKQYTNWDFIGLVAANNIAYHEKDHGQLFCDHSAKDILNLLVSECETANVDFQLSCETYSVSIGSTNHYQIKTNLGKYSCQSFIVATGGLSIPSLGGATGFGYRLAEQFGLSVLPTEASLVPFILSGKLNEFSSQLSGVSLPVTAAVTGKGFYEDMLFTHRGLSGPAILQLSNYWHLGEQISVDLLPNMDMADWLIKMKSSRPKKTLVSALNGILPKSLVLAAVEFWWSEFDHKPLHEIKNSELQSIAEQCHNWVLKPSGTEGYRTAEVTRGGVDVGHISSKTMECKQQQGLFFIGEVLDVTGHLGGFNFQWAWSSGYVAGLNA